MATISIDQHPHQQQPQPHHHVGFQAAYREPSQSRLRQDSIDKGSNNTSRVNSIRTAFTYFREEYGLLNLLLLFAPVAIIFRLMGIHPSAQFITAAIAIIPLAGLLGDATEALSDHLGPGTGGLLNATFGNAAELIIALFSVFRGLDILVKSSLVGSIISNLLLVLGTAVLLGGLRYRTQSFSQNAAGVDSNMCVVASIGFLVPSMFHRFGNFGDNYQSEHRLSLGISIIFLTTYIALLLFQLKTHADFFDGGLAQAAIDSIKPTASSGQIRNNNPSLTENTPLLTRAASNQQRQRRGSTQSEPSSPTNIQSRPLIFPRALSLAKSKLVNNQRTRGSTSNSNRVTPDKTEEKRSESDIHSEIDENESEGWSMRKSMIVLALSTSVVVVLSEILTGAAEVAGESLGLSQLFMGVIVVAIVGNAAEHASAVLASLHDDMNIAVSIAFGSALQIAMFVMPVVVLFSYARSSEYGPLDLTLTEFEVFAMTCSTLLSWMIVQDAASNWLEGIMLLVIYFILALAFYYSQDQQQIPTDIAKFIPH